MSAVNLGYKLQIPREKLVTNRYSVFLPRILRKYIDICQTFIDPIRCLRYIQVYIVIKFVIAKVYCMSTE